MKKKLFLAAAALALPMFSLAANYHYVDTSGQVEDVSAASADAALGAATDAAPHSGVALDVGVVDEGDTVVLASPAPIVAGASAESYQYVSMQGDVKMIAAPDAAHAMDAAPDIAPHSGVVNIAAAGTVIPPSTDVNL